MKDNNKIMSSDSIYINIHSLIHIVSTETTTSVKNYLNKSMGDFILDSYSNESDIDITLKPITLEHTLLDKIRGLKVSQKEMFVKQDKKTIVYFFYRNKIDYIIIFGSQIQLLYLPSKDIHKRLDGIMNFCIRLQLAKKNSLVCYGAVLVKGDRSIFLTGMPMIGKTMIILFLLSKKWDFIADNKFILANNQAYLWEDTIAMRPHYHFSFFSHLKKNIPSYTKVVKKFKTVDFLLKLAYQYFPRQLLPLVEEYSSFRRYYCVKVASVFPDSKILNNVKLTDVFVFSLADKISFEKTDLKNTVVEMSFIQKLLLPKLWLFENLLFLTDNSLMIDYEKILSKNLESTQFYRVTTLMKGDFKQFSQMLNDFLISLKIVKT